MNHHGGIITWAEQSFFDWLLLLLCSLVTTTWPWRDVLTTGFNVVVEKVDKSWLSAGFTSVCISNHLNKCFNLESWCPILQVLHWWHILGVSAQNWFDNSTTVTRILNRSLTVKEAELIWWKRSLEWLLSDTWDTSTTLHLVVYSGTVLFSPFTGTNTEAHTSRFIEDCTVQQLP